jgi:translation elongation factor EF-G
MTQGSGIFHREFSHYEKVPANKQQEIVEASKTEDN